MSRGRALRKVAPLLVLVALVLALRFLPLGKPAARLAEWVRDAGGAGVAVYALVYVAAAVLLLPASLLTLVAGFVWGPLRGTLLVWPTSVVAATAAFLVGRTLARARVERRLAGSRVFRGVDAAMAQGGLGSVVLLRLSPLFPFNLLNYALSLTRVSLRDFVLGSLAGMLPGTFLYVYLGSLVGSVADLAAGRAPASPARRALFAAGLVATAAVTFLVTRRARRALEHEAPGAGAAAGRTEAEGGAKESPGCGRGGRA